MNSIFSRYPLAVALLMLACGLGATNKTEAATPERELQGAWLGNERFNFEGEIFPFCTRVFIQPPGNAGGGSLVDWISVFGECKKVRVRATYPGYPRET